MKSTKLFVMSLAAVSALFISSCGVSGDVTSEAESSEEIQSSEEIVSSEDVVSSETLSGEESISSQEEEEPIDIFYDGGAFLSGGEAAAKENPGDFYYWYGDGGNVTNAVKEGRKYSLSYSYSSVGKWYGVQVFYKLPYSESGDTYAINLTLNSDVAGSITINGKTVTLAAGVDYDYSYEVDGNATTISLQLGIEGTPLGGAAFSLTVGSAFDKTEGATYYETKFVNGETVLKNIQVKSGKTVAAPENPTPESGMIFKGWYDGELKYSSTALVTEAHTYAAVFIKESEATKYTITYQNLVTEATSTEEVIEGNSPIGAIEYGFGYGAGKFYSDEAKTHPIELAEFVPSDNVTIYYLPYITPSGTCSAYKNNWGPIPASYLSHNDEGGLVLTDYAGDGGDANSNYLTQINFGPVPTAASGTYSLTFTYDMNVEGGDILIFDDGTSSQVVTSTALEVGTGKTVTVTYSATATSGRARVQIGLGHVAAADKANLTISKIAVELAA